MGGLPVTYPAGIDVYEIGLGVVPDSPSFHGCGCFSKFGQRAAGQPNVYGLSHHVQAVFGNATGVALEIVIGGRGPVSGDNLKRSVDGNFGTHCMENIEQIGVDDFNFIGPVVSKQIIDLL